MARNRQRNRTGRPAPRSARPLPGEGDAAKPATGPVMVPTNLPEASESEASEPVAAKPAATSPPASGIQRFAQAAFHWPTPLVYEVFFVLLALYVYIRWRQRYYVEGPP